MWYGKEWSRPSKGSGMRVEGRQRRQQQQQQQPVVYMIYTETLGVCVAAPAESPGMRGVGCCLRVRRWVRPGTRRKRLEFRIKYVNDG